uniref:Uncharacterized protein n=1 Tax=Arundo donax TaxID=35708 RepID=A0A0A9A695_ARUDO
MLFYFICRYVEVKLASTCCLSKSGLS